MADTKELRKKDRDELTKLLREGRKELVELRMGRKLGSLADGSKITKKRKEIARVLTSLKEKEVLEEVAARDVKKDA